MDQLIIYIQQNVLIAPWIIFGLLLLAGFNLPVSEDIMLFVSGVLASKYPEHTIGLFTGVFMGAYLSDLICYGFMGRYLGTKIFKIKFFASLVTPEKIEKVSKFYEKYGVMTLIIGRFIPFGLRNALFFTAGFSKMNAWRFALSDLLACTLSSAFFFNLYKYYGDRVIVYVKQGNIVLFVVLLLVALYFWRKNSKKM